MDAPLTNYARYRATMKKETGELETIHRLLARIGNMLSADAPLPMIQNEVRILYNYLKTLDKK